MISQVELNIIEGYGSIIGRTGVFALDWHPATKTLRPTSSRWKYASAVLAVASGPLQICTILRVVIQTSPVEASGFLPALLRIVSLVILPSYVLVSAWSLILWRRRRDFAHLLNVMLFQTQQRSGVTPELTTRARYFYLCHQALCITWAAGVLTVTILLGILTAAVESNGRWTIYQLSVFVVHTAYYAALGVFFLVLILLYTYHFLVTAADGLRPERKLEGWAFPETVHNYQTLSLLCKLYNATICSELVPLLKYFANLIAMAAFCVAVHLQATDLTTTIVKVTFFAALPYVWGAIIFGGQAMSSVWASSQDYVRRVARESLGSENSKLRNCLLKSLAPIRVTIAGLYHMEKEAKLTLIDVIIHGIVNVLLLTASS